MFKMCLLVKQNIFVEKPDAIKSLLFSKVHLIKNNIKYVGT